MPWEKGFNVEKTLQKVMQAFWAHGYEATSLQDLVDCTQVNRASLYTTYGGKRDLFLAALCLYTKVRRTRLTELERCNSPREAVRQLFQGFVEQAVRDKARRGCFLTNTALELAAHDAETARIVAKSQANLEAFFRRMVEAGQAKGEIPANLDPVATSQGLLAALLGLLVLARSRPDRKLLQGVADEALRRLG